MIRLMVLESADWVTSVEGVWKTVSLARFGGICHVLGQTSPKLKFIEQVYN